MKIQILDKTKKRKFLGGLEEFGVRKVPEMLVRSGMEKVRAFSGSLSREEIMEIWRLAPIESVGLYVGKEFANRNGTHEVRLSVDGIHAWQSQLENRDKKIENRIITLTEEQERDWFEGKDIMLGKNVGVENGFILVKSADGKDFVGMGKIGGDGKILFGYLPKERRRRVGVI